MEKYLPLNTNDIDSPHEPPQFDHSQLAGNEVFEVTSTSQTKKASLYYHRRSIAFHLGLSALNIFSGILYTKWQVSKYIHSPQKIYSPAQNIISYEARNFDNSQPYLLNGSPNPSKPTQFTGPPRPELEKAWKNLTQDQNVRILEEELGQFSGDESLVKLSDGSGYASTLAVFHGLHCVERLHHFMHREFYYTGISEDDLKGLKLHTEHCIDWLRQYVQCNADTTLIPLHWVDKVRIPTASDEGNHQCVRWEPVEKWMAERTFNAFEPGLLIHPIFGAPYGENNEGDKIGIVVDEE